MTLNENLPLAAMTIAEARQFFDGLICERLAQTPKIETNSLTPDTLNFEDAVAYLHSIGCLTAKRTVYNLTAAGRIPCKRFGKRLVFSRAELSEWVSQNTKSKASLSDAALTVAESARRKK